MTINLDIETYSSNDLTKCGVYKYVEAPDFTILLLAYSVDNGKVQIVDIAGGETIPDWLKDALLDEEVTKKAFNATFERICLSKFFGLEKPMPALPWQCTMVAAARMGLPLSLDQCGEVLNIEDRKMKEGKALIKKFSLPDKKKGRTMPQDDPEAWETFKAYCIRDVEAEMEIGRKVCRVEQPEWEQELYAIDQEINDRGVLINLQLAQNADRFNEEYKEELLNSSRQITGLDNPNSDQQLKEWLARAAHVRVDSLNKTSIDDVEKKVSKSSPAFKVLKNRREMKKTSNAKYGAMLNSVCQDGRVHGLLQYYGAARTGRWAGRLVQLQNLPQNHLTVDKKKGINELDDARNLVLKGDLDEFSILFGNVTQTLSELIRTSFEAKVGRVFHVCDFSAIEARVIAWLAGEEWVLDVFRKNGDIYCETASQMFKVPVEKHGRNAELRARGKVAVLGLGYGGGVNALENMGGSKLGLTYAEEQEIVQKWRNANPHIVRLWANIEKAAIRTITTGQTSEINRGILFTREYGCLIVRLPSGRKMCYPRAKYGPYMKSFGGTDLREVDGIQYEGMNQTNKKWEVVESYGGKMTENLIQAIARDILGVVMRRAHEKGMEIVFHVHDEIIVEARPEETLEMVEQLFDEPIAWAPGLPLKGAGYTTPYYLKD